jgi:hypothetical protein
VKIDPSNQSLILPGESPEADRRFERALRLNGGGHLAQFTLVTPPPPAASFSAASAQPALKSSVAEDAGSIDIPIAARGPLRRESRRWRELYRIVTQGDDGPPKGRKLDVVA